MNDALVTLLGWEATILDKDPCVFDRWRWLKRHLRPGPLRTLDAGSGLGAFTMYAARIGNEAVGISSSESNNRRAEARARALGISNIEFITADLRDLAELRGRLGEFDQVICLETIEHVRDDEKLVGDLTALLRPGGQLLLTTPFKHYRHLLGDKLSTAEDGKHVRWGYTHEEMRRLFSIAGLEVVAEEYVSGFVSQQITNLIRLVARVNGKLAWIVTFPLRPLQVLDKALTGILGYPHHCIAVVGIKPT